MRWCFEHGSECCQNGHPTICALINVAQTFRKGTDLKVIA
jgi:hypothetical protein